MTKSTSAIFRLLRCPKTGQPLDFGIDLIQSIDKKFSYQFLNGKPVLIDFESSIISKEELFSSKGQSVVVRNTYKDSIRKYLKRILAPVHPNIKKNINVLKRLLNAKKSPRILFIGGGSIGRGIEEIYLRDNIELLSFDVYDSPNIQFLADAHKIPLESYSIDCVVIQYVLEHVIEPQQVVGEIHRVLKDNAIVYAETPFLEQVHEGPFDFMRFTESGHRYLFNKFELIDAGVIAGAGTHLMWSIEYFTRALFRSWEIGKLFKLTFFWLQYFDRIIPKGYNIDAADSVYFLGRKTNETIHPKQMVHYYQGMDKKCV